MAVAACLVMAVPVFLTAMPPVMDFPNHLARIWLLAGGADRPPLSAIYEIRWWQASTNVAVDFFGVLLTRIAGLDAAAKVLLTMMFIGPPLGAAMLNRALFGRLHVWQLLGVMLAWSTPAIEGFVSFQIGIGAALLCAAGAAPLVHRMTTGRLIVLALTATGLLFIHPFAVLLFAACITGLSLGESLPRLPELAGKRGLQVVAFGAACMAPLILLFLISRHPPGAHNVGTHWVHWDPIQETVRPKHLAMIFLSPFLSYRALFDVLMIVPLTAAIVWLAAKGWIRTHAGLLLVGAVMLAISPCLPTNVGDGGALPVRFPVMAGFVAIAATRPNLASLRMRTLLAAVIGLSALVRVGFIAWVWHERSIDAGQLQQATQAIPPGASVLILQQKWGDMHNVPIGRLVAGCPANVCAAERHFGSLVVPWRRAFVPTLFTVPGQHPLGVKPPWRAKSVFASGIPFADDIEESVSRDPYLINWQDKFDFVLLLDADLGRTAIPGTEMIANEGFARLYRVTPRSGFAGRRVKAKAIL